MMVGLFMLSTSNEIFFFHNMIVRGIDVAIDVKQTEDYQNIGRGR